jgi:hypothetical protein
MEDMIVCPECAGKGFIGYKDFAHKEDRRNYKTLCMFCYGKRYIDWVQNITKKPMTVNNPLFLMQEKICRNLGDYWFKLENGTNNYHVRKEFIEKIGSEKWTDVIMSVHDDSDGGIRSWRYRAKSGTAFGKMPVRRMSNKTNM